MDKVLIIDFGSQYSKLIARRVRESNIYSELIPASDPHLLAKAKQFNALIFSGSPYSVYEKGAFSLDKEFFELKIPILGLCYGMQLVHHLLGGEVKALAKREYGKTELIINQTFNNHPLLDKVDLKSTVWMSHGDTVTKIAPNFKVLGFSNVGPAISANDQSQIYTFQFHPEVEHTIFGKQLLNNFLFKIAKLNPSWEMDQIIDQKIDKYQKLIANNQVILGLSGGVDSAVVCALLAKAIGKGLKPIFIDTGLLRHNEIALVAQTFKQNFDLNLEIVDAKQDFYQALKDVIDPEQKRKIIGRLFIEKFETIKHKYQNVKFLAQGTIYPDVIESALDHQEAQTIKSHHNVGGLPEKVNFEILEPLRDLFKDEVRKLGLNLGLSKEIIERHPFPGPGLAIRIIGSIDESKVKILQKADYILTSLLKAENLYHEVAQAAAILTPLKTVGVQGDQRTYQYLLAIRIVQTNDFMTAKFARLSWSFLEKLASKITNEVKEINRVVYDITSKPPATIEWE